MAIAVAIVRPKFRQAVPAVRKAADLMFITPAYAQGAGGGPVDFSFIFVLIAMFAIMYFLIIRPQRQQMRQREEMLKAIRRNDSIVTNGGIIGKVTKVVDDNEVEVQIAEGVKVRVQRSLIYEVRSKSEPVSGNSN